MIPYIIACVLIALSSLQAVVEPLRCKALKAAVAQAVQQGSSNSLATLPQDLQEPALKLYALYIQNHNISLLRFIDVRHDHFFRECDQNDIVTTLKQHVTPRILTIYDMAGSKTLNQLLIDEITYFTITQKLIGRSVSNINKDEIAQSELVFIIEAVMRAGVNLGDYIFTLLKNKIIAPALKNWAQEYVYTLFLEKGLLNVEVRNELGDTPLLWVLEYGNTDLVAELIAAGASIRAINNVGQTALIKAVLGAEKSLERGDFEEYALYKSLIRTLLESGLNSTRKDRYQKTAFDYAVTPDLKKVLSHEK